MIKDKSCFSKRFPQIIKYTDIWVSKPAAFNSPVFRWYDNAVLPWPMPEARTIKLKHNKEEFEYYQLYCGFDIETTNYEVGDKHVGFMYHWQFSIASDSSGIVFTGRTWSEFLHFMAALENEYKLSREKRLIIWVANLGFEFQYIRKYFEWDPEDFFAREERHPMKCRTGGFEFHEALTISGGSLAQLAKDYTKTQKKKDPVTGLSDLDYSILRNSQTRLTDTELDYCISDVTILAEWSKFIFDTYIKPDKRIPLTKTGLLRSECRRALNDKLGYDGTKDYRSLIYECFPDEANYTKWFKYLFRGGYVHSNILMTGFVIKHVDSYDITSSYPAVMNLFDDYPLEAFKTIPYDPAYLKTHACIMTVRFTNIKRKWAHSIESKSKCIELAGSKKIPLVIDNGRVAQAAVMTVMITNIDLEIYKMFYNYECMEILNFQIAKKGKLPIFIRKTLNKYYKLKNELKKAGKNDTPEYAIIKQKVNSFFGMMVTRIELDKIMYIEDNWDVREKELDYNEELKSQFLLPQWGIFVTALSRRQLLSVVAKITEEIGDGSGDDGAGVIYCDTDSIKYYDLNGKVKPIIDEFNECIRKLHEKFKLTDPAFSDLGMYDYEGHYKRFKTLGAKRYLVEKENGKIAATIAGLPKQSLLNYDGDPFDKFDVDGMLIDAEMSLKNGISYTDKHIQAVIDGEVMQEESCAGIFDMRFKMSLDKLYHSLVVEGLTERIRKYGD